VGILSLFAIKRCIAQEIPSFFEYSTSTYQSFYFFHSVYINDIPISDEDWVAAFNGEICIGSRQWNMNSCNSICDVPVLGNDGSVYTDGYINFGEYPSFLIYDVSEHIVYNATPSVEHPFVNMDMPIIDSLVSTDAWLFPAWDVNIAAYENNGSIRAAVEIDGTKVGVPGDLVAAFIENEVRGVGEASETPAGGNVFTIMTYSNSSGEVLSFKYYDSVSDVVIDLAETVTFDNDMIIGDDINPFILTAVVSGGLGLYDKELPSNFKFTTLYPNPFNPQITIGFETSTTDLMSIEIFDPTGSVINEILNEIIPAGQHHLIWNATDNSAGVYLIRGIQKDSHITKKVVLVK